jgi:predicted AlkP superfamily phosphohydrolase/phosphomutase
VNSMDNEYPNRLLIVGLDGLNWQLLTPLLDAGVMPHLDRLKREGAYGPLTSVVPTQSAAAWASFITGQNPARHGVLDFVLRQADGSYRHAKPHREATLWHYAGRAGLRVGVFNFPVTYPPDRVNGFLVSGMLSPKGRTFTHPPGLGDEILSAVPGYRLDLEWQLYAGREGALLRDLTEMTRLRALAARYLQARYPSDLLAVAFVGPDRLQHALWRHLDPTHPHHSPNEAATLAEDLHRFYATLDEALGQLVTAAGDGTAVIVLSDHGFQSAAWQFRVDEWLTERGWLAWQAGRSRLERLVRKLDTPWVRHVRRRLVKDISRHFPTFSPGGTVDWSRTAAFCPWTEQQGIRLNVKDRELGGIVSMSTYEPLREEIRHALLETTDPHSGQKVVDQVWRREELYEGPFFDQMPDLVFTLRPGFASSPTQQRLWSATGWASGDHSLEGILIAWGPGVAPGPVTGAELISVAPTALYLLDQPVPTGMDGKVLTHILTAPFVASHPLRFAGATPESEAPPPAQTLTAEEEADIQERLRGLGYL